VFLWVWCLTVCGDEQEGECFWVLFCFLTWDYCGGVGDGRKDTYGVFADPVDPEEVRRFFFL